MNPTSHTPAASANTHQGNDVVDIIAQEARSTALAFGASMEVANAQTAQFIDRVLRRLGGGQLYFPKMATARRREVHAWVRANWRGDNLAALAKATNLSERRIRQLVAEKV
jgi:Mor family transcriptional regulator